MFDLEEQPAPPSAGTLTREELSELVDVVLHVGQSMLQSGAASFRTEETMAQIGLGLGAERLEMYITPTGIIATAISGQEQRTRVGRVGPLGVNMAQTVSLNRLSRHVALVGGTLEGVRNQIGLVRARPRIYPMWVTVLAVALACGAFSQILGAGWDEFAAVLVGAGLAQFVRMRLLHAGVNIFALTVICSLIASMTAWGTCQLIDCDQTRLAVIASVLLLVPGVPLVTAVIDLTNSDLVSGLSRGMLALMITLSIGVGILLTLALTGLSIQ